MKIVSFNLNGIRAAINKGLLDCLREIDADIYCFQETKIDQLAAENLSSAFNDFQTYFHSAEKKGYSGVAIFSKKPATSVVYGDENSPYKNEGRMIAANFDNFRLCNVYMPSGTTGDIRQKVKEEYMDFYYSYIEKQKTEAQSLIITGDFNICHTEKDIHHPEKHHKVSGFLPNEREWMSKFINMGLIDSFRQLNPEEIGYTWWSYRAGSKEKNLGWRIDYIFTTQNLSNSLKKHQIYNLYNLSDHCPLLLEVDM